MSVAIPTSRKLGKRRDGEELAAVGRVPAGEDLRVVKGCPSQDELQSVLLTPR
jgi:hypothetical protein